MTEWIRPPKGRVKRVWPALLVAGLVAAGPLAGCGPADPPTPVVTAPPSSSSPSASPVAPTPGPQTNPVDPADLKSGGALKLAVTAFPASWNPWDRSVFSLDPVADALTPRLFTADADGVLRWDPAWLTAEPVVLPAAAGAGAAGGDDSEAGGSDGGEGQAGGDGAPAGQAGGMTVTYSLNPAAVWGDGAPVTAEDFAATWRACLASSGPVCQGRAFDHVTAVSQGADPDQVVVAYDSDEADWPATFARGPLRASVVEDPAQAGAWESPVGHAAAFAGPFRVVSFDQTTLVMMRNPLWWGDPPRLGAVWARKVDPSGLTLAYLRGEVDAFWAQDANVFAAAASLPDVEIRRGTGGERRVLEVNCAASPLDEPAVRQALLLGLDREAVADSDLAGLKWAGPVLNSPLWLTGQSQYEDLTKPDGRDSRAAPADGDPQAAARALLDQAGWLAGPDGIRTRAGVALAWDFLVPQADAVTENEAFGLRVQLAGLGIRLDLVYADPATAAQRLATGQYGMTGATWGRSTDLGTAHRFVTGNEEGYSNAVVDTLYDQARTQLDPARRAVKLDSIAAAVWQDAPVIPLYALPEILVTRPGLANYGPDGLGSILWERVGWQE